jgi:hypothetical protein
MPPIPTQYNNIMITPLKPHNEAPSCFEFERAVMQQNDLVKQLKTVYEKMNAALDDKISDYKKANPNGKFWSDEKAQNEPETKKLIDSLNALTPMLNEKQKQSKKANAELTSLRILQELGLNPLMCKPNPLI